MELSLRGSHRASKDARLSTGYGDAAIQNAVGRPTFPGLLGWTAPERHLCAMMRFVEDFIEEEKLWGERRRPGIIVAG